MPPASFIKVVVKATSTSHSRCLYKLTKLSQKRLLSGYSNPPPTRKEVQSVHPLEAFGNKSVKSMTKSADFTALARLLDSNEQWSKEVDKVEPGFFQQLSKGQSPQVISSLSSCSLAG